MSTTYDSFFKNEVRPEMGEDYGTASADSRLNDNVGLAMCKDYFRQYRGILQVEENTVNSIALTSGTKEYSLPSGFMAVKSLVLVLTDSTEEDITGHEVNPDADVPLRGITNGYTYPTSWYLWGHGDTQKIGFLPDTWSETGLTAKLRYYRKPTEPSAVGETIDLDDIWHPALKTFLLMKVARMRKRFAAVEGYRGDLKELLKDAKKTRHSQKVGGQSWRAPHPS